MYENSQSVTYTEYTILRPLIVAVLQAPDGKGITSLHDSQLGIDKCKVHAWSTTKEIATRPGKFT